MEDCPDFDYDYYEKTWESLPFAAGLTAGLMFLKYDLVSKALLVSAFGPVAPWLLMPILFATLFLQLLIGLKLFWREYPCEMKWEEKFLILTLPFSACILSLLLTVVAFNTITVGWLVGVALIGVTAGVLMSAYLYCKINGVDMTPVAFKISKTGITLEPNHEKSFEGTATLPPSVPYASYRHACHNDPALRPHEQRRAFLPN